MRWRKHNFPKLLAEKDLQVNERVFESYLGKEGEEEGVIPQKLAVVEPQAAC